MREKFHLSPTHCYLNAAFQGAQLKSGLEVGQRSVTHWGAPWEKTPQEFFEPSDHLRSLVAQLLRANARNIALVPSVSYGVETAIRNLPLSKNRSVLLPEDDFPSNVYPWKEACKRTGARLVTVKRPADFQWTTAICEAISVDTAVVSVPISDWSDGTFFDLRPISKRCKEVGAALVVDVSQSMGAVPIDLTQFDPDFLFSVGYKWQLGPHGLAYLYVADRHLAGTPLENNWLSRAGCEDFSKLTQYVEHYREGARRFDSGAHNQLVITPMAVEALRFLLETGVEKIFDHIDHLGTLMRDTLSETPLRIPERNRLCGHVAGLYGKAGEDMLPLAIYLRENGICVSLRGRAIRVSPHIYNDESDILRLTSAVKTFFANRL